MINYNIIDKIKTMKGVNGVRICFDDDYVPFTYHAMTSKYQEKGYWIPRLNKTFHPIVREWGEESTINSEYIEFEVER